MELSVIMSILLNEILVFVNTYSLFLVLGTCVGSMVFGMCFVARSIKKGKKGIRDEYLEIVRSIDEIRQLMASQNKYLFEMQKHIRNIRYDYGTNKKMQTNLDEQFDESYFTHDGESTKSEVLKQTGRELI